MNGTWKGLGHYTADDPTFRQKQQWWSQGYDWRKEIERKLTLIGVRLDAPAAPLLADSSNAAGVTTKTPYMMVGMNFPTLGCWKVTGRYHNQELTYVILLTK